MPSTPAPTWLAIVLLACTPAQPSADSSAVRPVEADAEAFAEASIEPVRPIEYVCRRPAIPESGYRFELNGSPLRPDFVSITGDDVLRPGDIVRSEVADMIVGPPGHYRYFFDPARPQELELEFDGGPRHLVALRVAGPGEDPAVPDPGARDRGAIALPKAPLRGLRGLALETWSDDIAAMVARLDGANLIVRYSNMGSLREGERSPGLPPALPADLRGLELQLALDTDLFRLQPTQSAPSSFALDGLPPLPGLRSLEVQVLARAADYQLEAASLGRFPALQRMVLDRSLPLSDPQMLRSLVDLRALDLRRHRGLRDVAFVGALPELRRLDVGYSGVTSLEPIAGHPHLAVVQADATPIVALPSAPPPGLRTLSVMATRLSAADVESFAATTPETSVRSGWNQRLADAAACATRIHVRTGGVCHRRPERERTLFAVEDVAAVRELLPLLHVDEARSDSYCMCCGTLTIELYSQDELLAEITLHHGRSLRYRGWPADGQLSAPRGLCAWLARHGVTDVCEDES